MQDLPVTLKWNDFQSLEKGLSFRMELKFCKSDVYFVNRRKNLYRSPLINLVQCKKVGPKIDSLGTPYEMFACADIFPDTYTSY